MKRLLPLQLLAWMICALLVLPCVSVAETTAVTPDSTVTVNFTLTSSEAVYASIGLDYDHNAFSFVSADGARVNPQNGNGSFIFGTGVSPLGTIAYSVCFKVLHAAPGNYTITPVLREAFTAKYDDVTIPLDSRTITVSAPDLSSYGYGAYTPATQTTDGSRGIIICTRCGKTLINEAVIPAGTELCIPDSTRVITENAFAGTAACQLRISEGVETIASGAFAGCSTLLLAILPDTLTAIADDAFTGCDNMVILCSTGNTVVLEWAAAHGFYVRAIDR